MRPHRAPRRTLAAVVAASAVALAASPAAFPTHRSASPASPAARAARALCAGTPRTTGALADPDLVETSGLAWSRAHRGVLWAHNDSGDAARVFAVRRDGAALGVVEVAGAEALDWEDIALGPGPGAADHLFLGDIGAGAAGTRAAVTVARIREPAVPGPGATGVSAPAATLVLRYPDGAHDAEALLVDGRTGDLVVLTKGADAPATVYRARGAATAAAGTTMTLEAIGPVRRPSVPAGTRLALELAGFGALADLVTGADASPAGVAVVRTYGGIGIYPWPAQVSLADALLAPPCAARATLDVRAPQGEAIALAPDARRLVTVSEGRGAPLVELRAARPRRAPAGVTAT